MNRAVTLMAFLTMALLLGACGSTQDSHGAKSEKDLDGQDLGPTEYNPSYPSDDDGEDEDDDKAKDVTPPNRPKSSN